MLAIPLVMLPFGCDEAVEDPVIPTNSFMKGAGETLVVAHRGGRDLWPENTMVAFTNARQSGVDVLEIDVCLTSDDILVTIHDVTIDRTCEASGQVLSYTFEELQQFNFGYHFRDEDGSYPYRDDPVRIPRIETILDQLGDMRMIIEIKNPGSTGKRAAQLLHDLVAERNLQDHVAVFSFEDAVMEHFRRINTGGVLTGGSIADAIAFVQAAYGGNEADFRRDVDVFSFPTELQGLDLITAADFIIEAGRNVGIAIHYWTINDPEEMASLVEKGVDGIITDKPDALQEVIAGD